MNWKKAMGIKGRGGILPKVSTGPSFSKLTGIKHPMSLPDFRPKKRKASWWKTLRDV